MSIENKTPDTSPPAPADQPSAPMQSETERQYETSGLYPGEGKSFRLLALLGWLAGVVVFIAISAVVLDRILI